MSRRLLLIGTLTLASSPACIALDGCEELSLTSDGGGAPTTTSVADATSSTGASSSGDGGASPTVTSAGGGDPSSSTGFGGGGPSCEYETCGDEIDQDCDGGDAACPAAHWLTWIPEPDGAVEGAARAFSIAQASDGTSYTTGMLDGARYYVAHLDADGGIAWLRTWRTTTSPQAFAVRLLADVPYLVGTANEPLELLDEDVVIGAPGALFGFVAELDPASGGLVDAPYLLDPTSGVSRIDVSTAATIDGTDALFVSAYHSGTLYDVPGPGLLVARFDGAGPPTWATSAVFANKELFLQSTALAAGDESVAVGFRFAGNVSLRDGRIESSTEVTTAVLQTFAVEASQPPERRSSLLITSDAASGGEVVTALAAAADGGTHVVLRGEDASTLGFEGNPFHAGDDNVAVYVRLDPLDNPTRAFILGDEIYSVGTLAEVEGGDALLLTAYTGQMAYLFDQPIDGPCVAEVDATGDAFTTTWIQRVMDANSSVPQLAVAPGDPATLRVIGEQQGDNPIDGSTESEVRAVPFVARLGR